MNNQYRIANIVNSKYYPLLLLFVSFVFVTLFSRATSFLYLFEGSDPSIFKQMGRAMLKGKILYIDYFDNKGCILYFIHALAFWLGGDFVLLLMQAVSLTITLIIWDRMLALYRNEKERMLEVMRNLKEFNMNLSIDDFGSGYSSLNLLRDIPFDVLKIDRGFLDESTQSESGKWILRKIVEMAEGLNLKVICEGVETHEQVEMLLDIGCIYAQGFLYSRPVPLEEFMDKYNTPLDADSPLTYYGQEDEYNVQYELSQET